MWLKVLEILGNLETQPLFSLLSKELSVKEHASIISFANLTI